MKLKNLIQYYNLRKSDVVNVNSFSEDLNSAKRIKFAIIDNDHYLHGINIRAEVVEIFEEYEAKSKPYRTILFTKLEDDTASVTLSISVNNKDDLYRLKEQFDDYGKVDIIIEGAFIKPLDGKVSLNLRMGSFSIGS